MRKEAKQWFRQSEADLKAAKISFENKIYEWSCFQAQQSGEKALKSYLYNLGYTSLIIHSLRLLVKECIKTENSFRKLDESARILDTYYIPTRYPNGFGTNVAPVDYYDEEDAKKCLKYAILILTTVKKFINK